MASPVLKDRGAIMLARLAQAAPIYCAWGSGDVAWDTVPVDPTYPGTALTAEIGRRLCDVQQFVTPDAAGAIILQPSANNASGRWTISGTPTPYLYLKASFQAGDSPSAVLREIGYFGYCELGAAVPPEQTYFLPADVAAIGEIFAEHRFPAISRNAGLTQSFEFVIDFNDVFQVP